MIRFADLVASVEGIAVDGRRVVVGLCGPPGVGKSTVSERLVDAFGARAVVVGMDGFHLADDVLGQLGLSDVKGAPQTFDVDGFVALIRRIRHADGPSPIYAPVFDRSIEAAVAGAVPVRAEHDIVIVEGNYLLMDGPWAPVRSLLDISVFLHLDGAVRRQRLIDRHVRHGRATEAATAWVDRSDEANARLVAACVDRADHILDLDGPAA